MGPAAWVYIRQESTTTAAATTTSRLNLLEPKRKTAICSSDLVDAQAVVLFLLCLVKSGRGGGAGGCWRWRRRVAPLYRLRAIGARHTVFCAAGDLT